MATEGTIHSDLAIPPHDCQRFVAAGGFSPTRIQAFAAEVGIDAGIVVGRLQHDGHLKHEWHNALRSRCTWAATTGEAH